MAMTKVYRKDTGEIVRVPAHWMDHPTLSKPFQKTPSQRAADAAQASASQEADAADAADAAQTSTPRTGGAAKSTSTPDKSAKAGDDDKKE